MELPAVTSTGTIRHAGPPLLLMAVSYAVLVAAGGATLKAAFAIPHSSAQQALTYVAQVKGRVDWGSFCEFGSALPLAVFVATAVSRLRFLGVRAAGEVIALSGGIAAVGMLLLAAGSTWSLTRPGLAGADGAVRALQAISFACGGPGFVAPLGLFVAGVSVTAGLHRLLPQWVMIFGLVVAAGCELASLTLVFWDAAWFIPFGRFLSIVWMIAVAVKLPSRLTEPRAAAL